MTIIKKMLYLSCAVAILALSFGGCSKPEEIVEEGVLSEEEINNRYEEMLNSTEEAAELPEGYNPIVDSFTTVDFQLTDLNNEAAFNLPENSFATITSESTNFRFFDYSIEEQVFDGMFKTAKGLTLTNTVAEFVSAYKAENANIICLAAGEYAAFEEAKLPEFSRISFAFSSDDGLAFSAVSGEELKAVLAVRDPKIQAGDGIDSEAIAAMINTHQTVAIVDVVPDGNGTMSEITISRFDKVTSDVNEITVDPF
ncbi:MAG: hypothetical protein E7395_05390 [Ruminococcaceae bacterium]|nr:hypothetical protein [Oscillospiraceae bacterium]